MSVSLKGKPQFGPLMSTSLPISVPILAENNLATANAVMQKADAKRRGTIRENDLGVFPRQAFKTPSNPRKLLTPELALRRTDCC